MRKTKKNHFFFRLACVAESLLLFIFLFLRPPLSTALDEGTGSEREAPPTDNRLLYAIKKNKKIRVPIKNMQKRKDTTQNRVLVSEHLPRGAPLNTLQPLPLMPY